MKRPEDVFRDLIEGIAEEYNYNSYSATIKPICSGGANYSSHLLLATVSAPGKDDLRLFAKVAAIGEKIRAKSPVDVYSVEYYFYETLLPKYRKIEERFNIPDKHRFGTAKFYKGSDEYLYETLVLENLTDRGFESFDRFKSIDWAYACFCVEQLALFHALSIAYSKHYPKEYNRVVKSKFSEYPPDVMRGPLHKAMSRATEIVKEVNRDRLVTFLENPDNRNPIEKLYRRSQFSVLIHGDYRPNNMMHKIQKDGKVEVIVLDYQVMQEGPPVTDLLYFILTGSDKAFRRKYMRKTIDLYYTELSAALCRYQLKPDEIYTKEAYEEDIKKFLPYMLSYSFFLLLMITVDESDTPKLEKELDVDIFDVAPSELYIERVNDLVDDFIAMEIL